MKKLLAMALLLALSANSWAEEKKKSVFVNVTKKSEIFDSYSYPAKVVPLVNAMVLSESQGVVKKIPFNLGEKVKAGQVLATIQHTDPVYRYRPVQLIAPVGGVVSRILVSEGSLVAKGDQVIMITDPLKHKIQIEVAARDLGYLKTGLEGSLKANGQTYAVKITGLSPFVDPATGSATAELKLAKEQELAIGSLGEVEFKANRHMAITLPEDAINYRGKKTFVRILEEGNKVKKLEIKLGEKRRGIVEVLEGLEENITVIERASGFLKEGSEVTVQNAPQKEKTPEVKEKKAQTKTEKEKA